MRKFLSILLVLMFMVLVFGTAALAIEDRLTRKISDRVDLISEDIVRGIMSGLSIWSESWPEYPEELKGSTSADFPSQGIKTMLQYCLDIVSLDPDIGNPAIWRVSSMDGKIGWIEYGPTTALEMVMSLGHIDTVGTGDINEWLIPGLWNNPVRSADGRIYGRGTTDDKGPTIASIYALKVLKDLGITVDRRIRVMFGTDEERPYWYGVNYYKDKGGETPVYGISPDGGITLHEKAIMNAWPTVSFDETHPNIFVVSVDTQGVAYNAITDSVIALIQVNGNRDAVMSNLIASIDSYPMLKGDSDVYVKVESADIGSDNFIRITSKALPGHGMGPTGINAYTRLMKVFTLFKSGAVFETVAANVLKAFPTDTYSYPPASAGPRSRDHETGGQTLGLYYVENIFGSNADTTVNIGLADWKRDASGKTRASFTLNIRFPQHSVSGDVGAGTWMMNQLSKALSGDAFVSFDTIATVTEGPNKGFIPNNMLAFPPMILDPNGWRVESIRRVGRMMNGTEPSVNASSGGGTYAKAFINRLFGMGTFSGAGGHGYNEYLTISSICPATKLMASAFIEMAAKDNFTWDVIGGAIHEYTKRNTALTDDAVSSASFDVAAAEIGTSFGISSLDVKTVRNLSITQLATGNTTVSFVVPSNENPLNYALFAKDAQTGAWRAFPFKASTRSVGDIGSTGFPTTVSMDCLVAAVSALGSTNTSTVAGQYAAQYAIAKAASQIYFPVTGLTVNPTLTCKAGETGQLTAAISPANATNKGLVWSSSNNAVATVSATGLVTGVGAGTATIVISSDESPSIFATCAVTVSVPVTGVTVNPPSATIEIDDTYSLIVTFIPTDATNKDVVWSTSNASAATVSNIGVVTAVGLGTATITVTTDDGGHDAMCTVTVVKHPTVPVTPTFPSNKEDAAARTGIDPVNLETKENEVFLVKGTAEEIAKTLLSVNKVNTNVQPVFEGTVTPSGRVAELLFSITGKELLASYPEEINLIGLISSNTGKLFDYTSDAAEFDDGKFTLLLGGAIFSGEIDPDEIYELSVFIKDGGIFDLDGLEDGSVIASIFIASEKTGGGGGGGCNAGYVYLALAIFGAVPFILRKRR